MAGAYIANHPEATMFGNPDSLNVGTSGSTALRLSPEMARMRTLPDLCASSASSSTSMPADTWPPINAFISAAPPAKGTCTMSALASRESISPKKCGRLPGAGEPKLAFCGLALSQATNSATLFTGRLAGTDNAKLKLHTWPTGAKSVAGL